MHTCSFRLFILGFAASIGLLPLAAANDSKTNSLTQKEIEEGWVLLFDGETTFGWKTPGDTAVKDGVMRLGGEKPAEIVSTTQWDLCELKMEFSCSKPLQFQFHGGQDMLTPIGGADKWVEMSYQRPIESSCGFELRSGERLKPAAQTRGQFMTAPIRLSVKENESALIRSIKIRPLDGKSLFNGKDLTGWKIFDDGKRNKAKWTVTKDGWLNVKNGSGALQTTTEFGNFVLQAECISNGDALNSGIFVRCIENQYLNGYEMQIHNGFRDGDRTKPSDFGTGAIYRRAPARRIVPNDREWFTMTLNAYGKHFATWVNGYQTVDWTDDRKEHVNPRTGSRTAPGHISIQGHDPTTDLSFRNLRVFDLPDRGKE